MKAPKVSDEQFKTILKEVLSGIPVKDAMQHCGIETGNCNSTVKEELASKPAQPKKKA